MPSTIVRIFLSIKCYAKVTTAISIFQLLEKQTGRRLYESGKVGPVVMLIPRDSEYFRRTEILRFFRSIIPIVCRIRHKKSQRFRKSLRRENAGGFANQHPGSVRFVDPDDCTSINILNFFCVFHNLTLTGLGRCAKDGRFVH